ncbi:MAG: DUF6134 family protein [Pseudomonadota bacterium]|nr:DUF6134 family protein [Pseudomonadota bacterium]
MLKPAIVGIMGAFIALNAYADETAELTSLPAPWVATDGAVIDFTVLRKGKPFGAHRLEFAREEDGRLTVTTDVDLQVKFGPITAFRYRLDSVEEWLDGQLVSLSGKSNSDGRKGNVTATANEDAMIVESTKFDGALPLTTIPSSHWNRLQVYQEQMLSTETGEVLDIEVETIGSDIVEVGGAPVEATHYRLKSDLTVDLWYDEQSRWVKLAFQVRGQDIEYVLNELY